MIGQLPLETIYFYALYGLKIRSTAPLSASQISSDSTEIFYREHPPSERPREKPEGEILAEMFYTKDRGYTCVRVVEGKYLARFYQSCDFEISLEEGVVEAFPDFQAPAGFPAVLFSGTVLALLLSLRGELVLHASAVERGGQAVAFVGGSGKGKSTVAALCCAAGASLVVDDVLRLKEKEDRFFCHLGTGEIRLRPAAEPLALQIAPGNVQKTPDGRFSVKPRAAPDQSPLKAVVFPQPSRSTSAVEMKVLSPARALYFLSCYPRIVGWKSEEQIRLQFHVLSQIARAIPFYEARIPWGTSFSPQTGEQLLTELGL